MPKPRASSSTSAAPARPAARYHHGDLRRALIDTALAMVTENDTWNFTLREVGRRAGVSHSAAYNHFEDKAALLAEVAVRGFDALRDAAEAAARAHPDSARDAFAAVAAAYVRFGVERPAHYRLMLGPELANRVRYPALQAASNASFQVVLNGVLERGQAAGEISRALVYEQAVAAWAMVHGLTTHLIDERVIAPAATPADAERLARVAAAVMFDGLRAAPA